MTAERLRNPVSHLLLVVVAIVFLGPLLYAVSTSLKPADEVFTPTPDEVDRARALVARFEQAGQSHDGVVLDDDGRMVDEALVRQARRLLARAR